MVPPLGKEMNFECKANEKCILMAVNPNHTKDNTPFTSLQAMVHKKSVNNILYKQTATPRSLLSK